MVIGPALAPVSIPAPILQRLIELGAPPAIEGATSYQILANHPPALRGWSELSWSLRGSPAADARVREIVIIRVAQLVGADAEAAAHEHIAREHFAVAQLELDAIAYWQDSDRFSPADRAALALADAVVSGDIPPDIVATLKVNFHASAVVDLVVTAGFYIMSTRVNRALGLG